MPAQRVTDNASRLVQRVGVFWDVEVIVSSFAHPFADIRWVQTCGIPPSMQAYSTITAISQKCTSYGALTTFRAYFERNDGVYPAAHTHDVLTLHGVSLLQYPQATRASNFERLLIADLFTFALDNPAPSTIVLITNAGLSSHPISVLRNRDFKIIFVSQYPLAFQDLAAQASEVMEWRHFLDRPQDKVTVPRSPSPTQDSTSVSPWIISQPLQERQAH